MSLFQYLKENKSHSASRSIRAAIFDVDGTILDSMPMWETTGSRFLQSIGKIPKNGLDEQLYTMTIEDGITYMISEYKLPLTKEEIHDSLLQMIDTFYVSEVCLKTGISDLIHALSDAKIPMALATTNERGPVEAALKRHGLYPHFVDLFTASELSTSKKEPKIYLTAASRLDSLPEETLVFEDNPYALKTAAKAGFCTVGVRDSSNRSSWDEICRIADYLFL